MVTSNQLTSGMTVTIADKLYRVESAVKVTVPKGTPFVKVKLRNLETNQVTEKNFKPTQEVDEVQLQESRMEYLYPEDDHFLFLDVGTLELVSIPEHVIGTKVNYLKESVEVKAMFYGKFIFSIELPQFLELMVVGVKTRPESKSSNGASKTAELETGAMIGVPQFIETGDIIKVDTIGEEYIQRV